MRGRRPKTDPPVKWKVSVPTSVANAINSLLVDPLLDEPAFGERSKLIEKLLRRHLKEQGVQL